MIVVIGSPRLRPGSPERLSEAAGLAAGIALAARGPGRQVQLVGRVGEDPAGESVLLALARNGIGHAATLRDAVHPTAVVPAPAEVDPDLFADPADAPEVEWSSLGPPGTATLDSGDLELALRYLDGFSVVVIAEPLESSSLEIVAEAAAYAGAVLVVLAPTGSQPETVPAGSIVLEAPASDPDGAFARTVGAFAAALDTGSDPAEALEAATAAEGWQRAEG
ncbi:MAG: PfkB family carbohydrate kinase [Chloroflexota bacterium]